MRPLHGYEALGEVAFRNGVPQDDCPHEEGTMAYLDWQVGWCGALSDSGMGDRVANGGKLMKALAACQEHLEGVFAAAPGVDEAERAIEMPASEWHGRCFEIATKVLESGILDDLQQRVGKLHAVYGKYCGPVAPGSYFDGKPIIQHGWIENESGLVIDPTRFVFAGENPYLWFGSSSDYDLGGQRLKNAMHMPAPDFTPEKADALTNGDMQTREAFDRLLGGAGRAVETGSVGIAQMFWIGTLSLDTLGEDVALIYEEFKAQGKKGFVPIDLMKWYEEVHPARNHGVEQSYEDVPEELETSSFQP